ncbi:MAG TPA: TIGR03621 family F420-dependent LLM class oxidoreductase [Acidimicrobiales bacterium]|nr:TIGR03621 family F420-dependent LLM class oxidoreductase [Acidimicrobiales bacterium]
MLRFGTSMWLAASRDEWRQQAQRAEASGFDTIFVADHVGMLDPFAAMMAVAEATERVTVGTYVLNVEFWNPLLLARAAASVDLLTSGRLLLGIGAGHARVEFEQAGLDYPPPPERVTRLERVVAALRRLLDGDTVDDEALGLRGASTGIAPARSHVPLLVGGNGDRVLRIAGARADVAGLVGFTSGTGQRHRNLSHWTFDGLRDRIEAVRAGVVAAGRRDLGDRGVPVLDLLVQRVVVTDDRAGAIRDLAEATGTDPEMHLDSPFVLVGTEDEIEAQLRRTHEELGVDGVTVFAAFADSLAPVVERLRR